ncbi:hypothetical protein D2962_14585 [Biomaibacter acetigenes]|uniref:Uncharacterized protein n=1 Tax=Biomaibacter acetigenes TaxID=2316383 RepID=A0A3G2R848_9FIRM|nr:hypothetical protein D2962_14585 [Biomaibacter acetigenes]RKL61403.1 hypothetical protein DXT63_16920 [Thermoanaerobacteraceae bacterium SP2]
MFAQFHLLNIFKLAQLFNIGSISKINTSKKGKKQQPPKPRKVVFKKSIPALNQGFAIWVHRKTCFLIHQKF